MQELWLNYQRKNSYAAGISWKEVLQSVPVSVQHVWKNRNSSILISAPSPPHRPRHFLQPRIRIGKEILIRAAVGVQPRRAAVSKKRAIPAAAVAAEWIPVAGTAFLRRMTGERDKLKFFPLLIHFFKGILPDISQLPFIQHIKITGIDGSVRLYNPLIGADSVHAAGLRRLADQNADPVFKGPVVDRAARLPVRIPVVEQVLQKFPIAVWRERIGEASLILFKGIDAGDILLPDKALILKETVDPADASCGFRRNHGQNVKIHLIPFQQFCRFQHTGKAPASVRELPVFIVKLLITVKGQPHQKMIVVKELCPFLIQHDAVGLQAVMNRNSIGIVFLFQFNQMPIEIQSHQRRLPSLKGERGRMGYLQQRLFHQNLQRFFVHEAAGGFASEIHFIRIKTVTAAQITASGGRFDQQGDGRLL